MKKTLIRNKRGIFFTSIAILISAVLVLTFGTPASVTTKEQIPLTQAKADMANAQARDLKYSYLPQSLYVSTYSALYAMSEYMRLRGGYFQGADADQKFNATLKEVMINGTICCGLAGHLPPCDSDSLADVNNPAIHKGADDCLGKAIMKDRNFTKRLKDMENASFTAFRINTTFNKDYNNMVIQLFQDNQTGPWQIGVNISVNYSITAGDVMINNSENVSVIFGIEGIPDPLYAVQSQQTPQDGSITYTNYFNATNITNWNISAFYHEIEWRLYRHEPNGSSFLNRFYGRDERSPCCGVESLINPADMGTVNGALEKPYVDWCYYGRNNRCTTAQTGAMWNVTCVTAAVDGEKFFKYAIDTFHATQYNITNYLYDLPPSTCPEIPFP
ncbi:hypothetical protein HYU40_03715 [Candidatus Woesearchaeota archaeon]|nr:hypothetical protein [Candidatus Woesearchaeota archaeon]